MGIYLYAQISPCVLLLTGELEDAVQCQEKYLSLAQAAGPSVVDQDRAYRGLGNAHRAMGNLQQALGQYADVFNR